METTCQDLFGKLPPEIYIEIFSYLSAEELLDARQVNKQWRELVNSEYLWRNICGQYNILDYTPSIQNETVLNYFCPSAKKYLCYEKTLRNNWISAKYHVLDRLTAATTESITNWKKTFVRTYFWENFVDIFKIDSRCNVERLQRLDTRFKMDGSDAVLLNDSWLAISRLNIVLLYKIQFDGQYELKWILVINWDPNIECSVKYLFIKEKTSLETVDEFLQTYMTNEWLVVPKCLFDGYIWVLFSNIYIIININTETQEANIVQRYTIGDNDEYSLSYDRKGVAATILEGVALCHENGVLKYLYPVEDPLRARELRQNSTIVAFKHSSHSLTFVNRKTYSFINVETVSSLISLHPTKPLAFITFWQTYTPGETWNWKMRCYCCKSGEIIWHTQYLPQIVNLQVIHNRFLHLTPIGSHKFSLYDCNTGKMVSISEEEYSQEPMTISDMFTVLKVTTRNSRSAIIVRCYL